MNGKQSKRIGKAATEEYLNGAPNVMGTRVIPRKIIKRQMKKAYLKSRNAKVIKMVISKRQQRLKAA